MFKYQVHNITPEEEPPLPHITQRFQEPLVPVEDELRYLGNAWNYCGYFHKELNDCVQNQIKDENPLIFKACKESVENLHHCYTWREPSDFQYNSAFLNETQDCLLQRDTFIKCYLRQADPWDVCHQTWIDIYRCKYRKNPSTYNIN
jgi:hypothetical protein